jgi:hypothetical protein
MKLKSTILLTFGLFLTMLGAGFASGWYSYKVGAEALEGVSQPDVNPTRKITGNQEKSDNPQEFTPINEKDIIKKTETYIKENSKTKPNISASPATEDQGKKENTDSFLKDDHQSPETASEAKFPLTVQDQGVTLEVVKTETQGSSLVLEINLKNDSAQAVEFLYSFLEVKDNQGNSLIAITDGLPDILPANGEKFSGTVKVPTASVAQGGEISLSLTDYPEQKLQLSLSKIPVTR